MIKVKQLQPSATNAQVLTTSAGAVVWANATGGGGGSLSYERKSAGFTAAADTHYSIDTTGGAVTATLPASSTAGAQIRLKLRAGANAVTITPDGSDTIDGLSSYTLDTLHATITLVDSGLGAWEII